MEKRRVVCLTMLRVDAAARSRHLTGQGGRALTRPPPPQQALDAAASGPSAPDQAELARACRGGLARTMLHLGDVAAGRQEALQVAAWALKGPLQH
jgi:hypothetical protein